MVSDWRKFTAEERIAYFSMEIGLEPGIPTYSGGLGVLAGDTLKSAADLRLPMVAVTLVYRQGYFSQALEAGRQVEAPTPWRPEERLQLLPVKTLVAIEGRDVKVQGWLHVQRSPSGGEIPVLFLDTDIPGNADEDRRLTDGLYAGDRAWRLKQEIVLGIGGVRLLDTAGFAVKKYHLNEGHAALLALELLSRERRRASDVWEGAGSAVVRRVARRCVFTTHTPVEAGHDQFDYDLVRHVLGEPIPLAEIRDLAGRTALNMTRLALSLSRYVNGVAKKHGEVSQKMFPGYQIHAITNGVHPGTWVSPAFASLFDRHLPGWAHEPELLARADTLPEAELLAAHAEAKAALFGLIQDRCGVELDPRVLTFGFARRAATYKRADLIFSDLERLLAIAGGKLQLVFAGKAHPHDEPGKALIARVHEKARELGARLPVVYLPDYNMELSATLIPGVDVWLNTPLRPLEASGTSGMKAVLNAVPNFSVLDGWWIEGHIEGVTGWSIGPHPSAPEAENAARAAADAEDFYTKLQHVLLPLYYENPAGWLAVMKGALARCAFIFNTHHMLRRYVAEAYIH